MRQTLEHMKDRSKEDKTAIAGSAAIGIVAVLFIIWLLYFFYSLQTITPPNIQNTATSLHTNGFPNVQQQTLQAYGSTTQFVGMPESVQLDEMGSTSTAPSL